MVNENKTLTPTWIAYINGIRLSTNYEGVLKSIRIYDGLNKIGRAILAFNLTPDKFDDEVFSLMSKVSIYLGYKDDIEEIFSGIITGIDTRLEEYGSSTIEVTVCTPLFQMQNESNVRNFINKTPSEIIRDILESYNIKCEVEEFGPRWKYIEQFNESDLDFILRLASKYARNICFYNDKVIVKSEIATTADDVILEWGKSLISARPKTKFEGRLSQVVCFGHDILSNTDFSATVQMKDLPLKIGGQYTWEDNSIGYDIHKTHAINGGIDYNDAKEIALSFLLRNSLEYQTCTCKCEGNHKIKLGNRITVKYLGEEFSGEYLIDHITHEFSVLNGYTTECFLKRNCCDTCISWSNESAVDLEMLESTVGKTSDSESQNNDRESDIDEKLLFANETVAGQDEDVPHIKKVELLDDNNNAISRSEIINYVNLPDKSIFIDNDKIKGHFQLNGRIKCKISFNKKGVFDFNVALKNIELKSSYDSNELNRNSKYKFSKENESKHYKTDSDGTKIISLKDFYLGQGGGNLFKFKAWTSNENNYVLSDCSIRTWRRLYYVEIKMATLSSMANSLSTAIREYEKQYIELIKIGTETVPYRENIDITDSASFKNDVSIQCNKAEYTKYSPYVVNITYTGHLAVKENREFRTLIPINSLSYIEYELKTASDESSKPLWMNIDTDSWFNDCALRINGTIYRIPESKIIPLEIKPNYYSKIKIDISDLPIQFPATAELLLDVKIINRMRAGLSFGGTHTVALCTKAYWNTFGELNQNQVLIHELGHQVGMVPNGSIKSKLNKGTYYYAHTHVGDHCYKGCSSTEALKSSSAIRKSECVMFGATNNKSSFCTDCGRNVKRADLSGGLY